MNIASLATAIGVAVLIATAPVLAAGAPAGPSPVKINAIAINMSDGQLTDFAPGNVAVAYTNMNAVAATRIVFDLAGPARIDKSYLLYGIGLLAEEFPDAAFDIASKVLLPPSSSSKALPSMTHA